MSESDLFNASTYPHSQYTSPASSPYLSNYYDYYPYYNHTQQNQAYNQTVSQPWSTQIRTQYSQQQADRQAIMDDVERCRQKVRRMEREKEDDGETIAQLVREAQEREAKFLKEALQREAKSVRDIQELRQEMEERFRIMQKEKMHPKQSYWDIDRVPRAQTGYSPGESQSMQQHSVLRHLVDDSLFDEDTELNHEQREFLKLLGSRSRQNQRRSIEGTQLDKKTVIDMYLQSLQTRSQTPNEIIDRESLRGMVQSILADLLQPTDEFFANARPSQALAGQTSRRIMKKPRDFQAEASAEAAKYATGGPSLYQEGNGKDNFPTRFKVPLRSRASTRYSSYARKSSSIPDPEDVESARKPKQPTSIHAFDSVAGKSGNGSADTRCSHPSLSPRVDYSNTAQHTNHLRKASRESQIQKPSGYQKPSVRDACEADSTAEDSDGMIFERERTPYYVPEPPSYPHDEEYS